MNSNNPDNRVMFAAMALSVGSEAAHIAFSDVVFALGEINDRQRDTLLDRLNLWEQLVSDDVEETKRMFRVMVEEKVKTLTNRR
jgi:hypothetical protein